MSQKAAYLVAFLSLLVLLPDIANAQAFTNADIVQDLSLYVGSYHNQVYNGVSDLWRENSATATLNGTLMTINLTDADMQENRANHQTCFTSKNLTTFTFDTRDMSPTATIINAGGSTTNDWRVDIFTISNARNIRQTNTAFDPTCGSGTKEPPSNWTSTYTIDLQAMSQDAANRLKAIIAVAWKAK